MSPGNVLLRYVRRDHAFMVEQAVQILINDGHFEVADFLQGNCVKVQTKERCLLDYLKRGIVSPDGLVDPRLHYHQPFKHKGFSDYNKSAADFAVVCYEQGQKQLSQGNNTAAVYSLGQTLHMLQDAYVPHHAGLMGGFIYLRLDPYGHYQYEKWLGQHWRSFAVKRGGDYSWQGCHSHPDYGLHKTSSIKVYDWVDDAAACSLSYLVQVNKKLKPDAENYYSQVASVLVPHTLRRTAGLIYKFFREYT